jgi:hypothetical protein
MWRQCEKWTFSNKKWKIYEPWLAVAPLQLILWNISPLSFLVRRLESLQTIPSNASTVRNVWMMKWRQYQCSSLSIRKPSLQVKSEMDLPMRESESSNIEERNPTYWLSFWNKSAME